MSKREKSIGKSMLFGLTVLAAMSLLFITSGEVRAAAAEPIKIGAIIPYTWEDPTIALIDKAIKMKLDEVGWKVAGRTIEFLGEDDAGKAVTAVEKAKKLVELNKVAAIIGPVPANNMLAVANYTGGTKTPNFTVVQMPYQGNKNAAKNVFSITGTQQGSTKELGSYAYELGYRSVAVLQQDFVAGDELSKGFIDAFESKGGKVVQRQRVPVGTMDYAPYVAAIQKADAFVCWLLPQETLRLMSVYYSAGPGMPFILLNGSYPEEMLQQTGDKTLGMISVIRWNRYVNNPVNKAWVETFVKKLGAVPTTNAAAAYDQTSFLVEGLKATNGDTRPEVLIPAIKKLKLSLPSGMTAYGEDGVAIGDMRILKVEKIGGKIVWNTVRTFEQVVYKSPNEK